MTPLRLVSVLLSSSFVLLSSPFVLLSPLFLLAFLPLHGPLVVVVLPPQGPLVVVVLPPHACDTGFPLRRTVDARGRGNYPGVFAFFLITSPTECINEIKDNSAPCLFGGPYRKYFWARINGAVLRNINASDMRPRHGHLTTLPCVYVYVWVTCVVIYNFDELMTVQGVQGHRRMPEIC
ncbi:hypothetical protein NQ318_016111 [Aromia moschata]|uniref:Secreted protein n=1 Tax=Aromia moschata TaxID=1265417 RepID=A0AAV8XDM7_9CUCU|nr:hypothetical protein NQ318_016111 [Aromia moschata]